MTSYITGLAGGGTGYFADNGGQPKLAMGDALWAWPGNAGRWNSGNWQADFDGLVANRAAQGYTVLYCKPIGTTQSGNLDDFGKTFDSLYPFQGGTPSTGVSGALPSTGLTSAFWARIDYMLNSALNAGITIFLNATGYESDWSGPATWAASFTATDAQTYGNLLGTRYKNQPNLAWSIEDDYFGGDDTRLNSLLTGIRAAGDTHPITIENMPESTSRFTLDPTPATCSWGNSNAQWNLVYSYNCEYLGVEQAYKEASPIPVLCSDGYFYQGGGSGSYFATFDRSFRQGVWWALASGSRGYMHGSEAIWQWASTALADSATEWFYANNHRNIANAVSGLRNWHMLLPDTTNALVTGGRGTRATTFASGGGGGQYEPAFTNSYVAASVTADGSLALLYLPNATTITINQSLLRAGYTAWWIDPITGVKTTTTAGSTYNSTAKGSNSQGDPDWALALQAPADAPTTATVYSMRSMP